MTKWALVYHIDWGRDKMAVSWQTTFQNAIYGIKTAVFRYEFHWNLFQKAQLTMINH